MERFGDPAYGLTRHLPATPPEEAIPLVREALAAEGFGVLTEIDVRATFEKKLGVSVPPYVILGACHPTLAHRALSAEPGVGLLLPCNVVVAAEGAGSVVSAADPRALFALVERPGVAAVADEVRERLGRVLASVGDAWELRAHREHDAILEAIARAEEARTADEVAAAVSELRSLVPAHLEGEERAGGLLAEARARAPRRRAEVDRLEADHRELATVLAELDGDPERLERLRALCTSLRGHERREAALLEELAHEEAATPAEGRPAA